MRSALTFGEGNGLASASGSSQDDPRRQPKQIWPWKSRRRAARWADKTSSNLAMGLEASAATARMPRTEQPAPADKMAAPAGPLARHGRNWEDDRRAPGWWSGSSSLWLGIDSLVPSPLKWIVEPPFTGAYLLSMAPKNPATPAAPKATSAKTRTARADLWMLSQRQPVLRQNIGHHGHGDGSYPGNMFLPLHSQVVPSRRRGGSISKGTADKGPGR